MRLTSTVLRFGVRQEKRIGDVFLHAILTGAIRSIIQDTVFLKSGLKNARTWNGAVASVSGRYYAMDRDNKGKGRKAYRAIAEGKGEPVEIRLTPFSRRMLKKCMMSSSFRQQR